MRVYSNPFSIISLVVTLKISPRIHFQTSLWRNDINVICALVPTFARRYPMYMSIATINCAALACFVTDVA